MRISDWSSDVCSSDLSFSSRSLFLRRRVLRNDHSNQRCGGENLLPVAKICAVRHAMSPVFDRLAGHPPCGEWIFPPSRLALTQVIEKSPSTLAHKITNHSATANFPSS